MIEYSRPRLDEAEVFAALHVQCWREAYVEILPPELLATFDASQRLPMWQRILADEMRIVIAAYDGGPPVGFIVVGAPLEQLHDDTDGQIDLIYLAASHYRQGVGRALVGRGAQAWLSQGGRSLTLGVLAHNTKARSFYESLGAKLVKTGTYNWSGFDLPDAIYVFEDLLNLTP